MQPWLILPVKSIRHGKSRLAACLSASERCKLNRQLLARSLALAACFPGLECTIVVSRCDEVLEQARARGVLCVVELGRGLNSAVEEAMEHLPLRQTAATIVASCDLPLACEEDLRALAGSREVVIATDRTEEGTNALCIPPGEGFCFHYGVHSRRRHAEEARRRALPWRVLVRPRLAFDLDTPGDFLEWKSIESNSLRA